MPTVRHHVAAIVVAALLYFVLGAAWFTLFMKSWLVGIGRTLAELQASGVPPWLTYGVALIMALGIAVVLSWVIQATGPQTASRGARLGALMWLGFVLTTWATEYAFEARGLKILAINAGYPLVGMMLMGLVLGGWRVRTQTLTK